MLIVIKGKVRLDKKKGPPYAGPRFVFMRDRIAELVGSRSRMRLLRRLSLSLSLRSGSLRSGRDLGSNHVA
jgi:hypothetical protein